MSIVPYSSRQHRFGLHAHHRCQSRTNHVVERDYSAVARQRSTMAGGGRHDEKPRTARLRVFGFAAKTARASARAATAASFRAKKRTNDRPGGGLKNLGRWGAVSARPSDKCVRASL